MEAVNGKYIFGVVKVGERGQIVIPKEARELYEIKAGDSLMVLGDQKGIAMLKPIDTIANSNENDFKTVNPALLLRFFPRIPIKIAKITSKPTDAISAIRKMNVPEFSSIVFRKLR